MAKTVQRFVKRVGNSKKTHVTLAIAALALVSVWLYDPFKVTDPNDPRFDPMKFRFSDCPQWFHNIRDCVETFRVLFHQGMSRGYVENILITNAGARTQERAKGYYAYHWYSPSFEGYSPMINVVYADDKAIAMSFYNIEIFNMREIEAADQRSIFEERERVFGKHKTVEEP